MTEPVSANEIRKEIRASLHRLRRLAGEGRIVMTKDSWNTNWPDSAAAIAAADAALEQADDAMLWMHTLPDSDGGYPPISE
ncbi:hypothetical protein [Subtercola boreus]|uniref:hypothetical protein n=1 Tax=Subtercola boreus TaxID=120213 RepID=UPI0011C029CE|nr:hypothetical protein [Subtercola boreus]